MTDLRHAIDSAHAEIRRLYCVNYGGQTLTFIADNKRAIIACRKRLAALYAASGDLRTARAMGGES